ncbi:MAG: hypothetical protein H7334_11015, partial [Ferruginibacter sp.]|nr:hypothetical protein [Ferruginibacter sp.]
MKKYLFSYLLLFAFTTVFAKQDSVIVPIYRQLFHDKINNEQIQLDRLDGKTDGLIRATHKPEINQAITYVMTKKVDEFENFVELNKKIVTNNEKIKYLGYIENLLKAFKQEWRSKEFNPVYTPMLVDAFEKILKKNIDSISMASEIDLLSRAYSALGRALSGIAKALNVIQAGDKMPNMSSITEALVAMSVVDSDKLKSTLDILDQRKSTIESLLQAGSGAQAAAATSDGGGFLSNIASFVTGGPSAPAQEE